MHTFQGIWLPIVTPFRHDGMVDHVALAKLARHYADAGIAGFVSGATTGEGVLLDVNEQDAIFATLRTAVPERPVVVGLTTFSTQQAVERARQLASLRPDGILATPPAYVRPTQDGIRRHFEAITAASDLPLMVYNIPYRTGVSVDIATLQALALDPRIVAVKECGGSLDRFMRLVHETPLRILSGDDNQNFAALCAGAHGTIASSAHVFPEWHVRMHALLREGQLAAARRLALALQPLIAELFAEPNPAPVKALLAAQGWLEDGLRLPFVPASAALRAKLLSLHTALATDKLERLPA